jgi:anti-anti-sigma regulatory factor
VKAIAGGGKPGYGESKLDRFSTSELFAIDVAYLAADPELEEAAIRFASGDDAGAESGLLAALRQDALLHDVALSWAAALLDLYRATNNRAKFDAAVLEFAMRFDKMTPQWFSISGAKTTTSGNTAGPEASFLQNPSGEPIASGIIWESPAELTVDALEALREIMASQPTPWHLGWSSITYISDDAMPLLAGLFGSLCNEPVALRFSGVEKLVQTLRSKMPSGDRSIDSLWWSVRLNALRAMKLHDEFELAALDYCVTYEVSPPAWEPARCDFESVVYLDRMPVDVVPEERVSGFEHVTTSPMNLGSGSASALELRGDVLGDASQALTSKRRGYARGDHIVISCKFLVRVDFSAAGSVLNWVAVRQAEGCIVQFKDVHRLVAAFFNVIGINEHARVIPRAI